MLKDEQGPGREHQFSHQIGVLDPESASAMDESSEDHKHPSILPSIEERVTSLRVLLLITVGSHPRNFGMHIKPRIRELHAQE
jgi:hypothetical protein